MDFEIKANLSPYQFAKKLGVRPQMVYNYIGSKRIAASKNALGKWEITAEEATAFGKKYLARKALRRELGYK